MKCSNVQIHASCSIVSFCSSYFQKVLHNYSFQRYHGSIKITCQQFWYCSFAHYLIQIFILLLWGCWHVYVVNFHIGFKLTRHVSSQCLEFTSGVIIVSLLCLHVYLCFIWSFLICLFLKFAILVYGAFKDFVNTCYWKHTDELHLFWFSSIELAYLFSHVGKLIANYYFHLSYFVLTEEDDLMLRARSSLEVQV